MSLLLKNKITIFFLFVLLFLPAVFSLFHTGFFLSDDGNWMVVRFSAFYEALRSGQFPVRFLPRLNFGYGYPVADFLYPLFMYIGVPIHVLGANFMTTIKIIFGLSLFISGLGTFFWLKKLMRNTGALVGSLIYLFFPYHIFDVYQRGSIGETLALSIVPLVLWQAERKHVILSSLFLAFLILSHNSLAVLFFPIIIGYFLIRKLFSLKQIFQIIAIALCLSACFWIPALYDKQFTVFDTVTVSSLQTYFLSGNTYYFVGWIFLVCLLMATPFLFIRKNPVFIYFFTLSIFSVFMALPISNNIWQLTRIAPFFQFPYRFLSLTILGIAYLGAMLVEIFPKKFTLVLSLLLLVILYFSSWNLLFPKTFQYFPDSFYSTNQDSTTVKNEYMPKWVKVYPQKQASEKVFVESGGGSVRILEEKGTKLTFNTELSKNSNIIVNFVDFPGWKATVDGEIIAIFHDNSRGLIRIVVPKGTHTVQISFSETPIRLFADMLSLLSFGTIIFLLVKQKYEK